MQTYILCSLLIAAVELQAADLAVKQVTLYKHGIGFFEREGAIPAGEEARLDFKNTDMNDVLKSLMVSDTAGGHISGIRYDSNESLAQQLQKYPFTIGNGELLSAFLDGIKGARLEVKTGDRAVTGTILGARSLTVGPEADRRTLGEQLTLLLDSSDVTNYDLGALSSLRLLDPHLQEQLKQYLQTLAQAKSRDKRSIYIDSAASGGRSLRLSYIMPAAVWKSSYRLSLEANPTLEGWAIVDNTTDEDWTNVRLSVVSGRPISFVSLLDTPRYGNRQVAELPEDRAAGPVVYGGSVDTTPSAGLIVNGLMGSGSGNGYGPGIGGGVYRNDGTHLGAGNAPLAQSMQEFAALQAKTSSVHGATGATLGELFEYHFAGPITVKKNQSAMLPFLQDKIAARKLLIYTENDGEHPVNAAEVTNNTAKTLDGGPITVFDSGAYAGEALFETLKAGDKRLIGYAVDYGTRITSAFGSVDNAVREISAQDGVVQLRYAERQTRTYTIKNVDAKPKTLIVQQNGIDEYSVLSPKPAERTATAYRFEVHVAAAGTQELKVEQERITAQSTAVTSATPDFLAAVLQNKQLSDTGRRQLQVILDLKRQATQTQTGLDNTKSQIGELTDDQTRLRQNIDSLNRVKGQEDQVRQYSSQLAANEGSLAKLRDQHSDLSQKKASLDTQIKTAISRLDF